MKKSYLRFEPKKSIGVIASPNCNVTYDFAGNLAITATVQDVSVWNLRQASQVALLSVDNHNYPYKVSSEVVILKRSPDKCSVVVGYANGDINIFNYLNNSLVTTLKGHRSAISSFAFDQEGTVLASGSNDCDIILWDLVSFTGICKLRDHKDAVTGLEFYTKESQKLLVSASKDSLLKVWDLGTRYCIQTIVGHRCEIWSLALLQQENDCLIVTGSADELLRGYKIKDKAANSETTLSSRSNTSNNNGNVLLNDEEEVLEYIGCITRNNTSEKCSHLTFNSSGSLLAAVSSGKYIEIYKVRDIIESKKKMKRRLKRKREKENNSGSNNISNNNNNGDTAEDNEEENDNNDATTTNTTELSAHIMLSDEIEWLHTIRCSNRVRGFAFCPTYNHTQEKLQGSKALISFVNNSLETYHIPTTITSSSSDSNNSNGPARTTIIDIHGHRSDIRAISLSSDGQNIATCSNEGIKIWSTRTLLCIGGCKMDGYCVSMCYAPGGRYIIVGTKEGHMHIVDTASGEIICDVKDDEEDDNNSNHDKDVESSNKAIWSIAVRPDGKGFMSGGADKFVKFWDFTVNKQGLGATLSRKLLMSQDVLCVRYSHTKSQDKLLIAAGLLDNTVKIFYDDSLKFYLSLYGHKLPIMCLDISYDNTLIVTGSADKTIKIWGLDFGDCHRSLIGHEDSVTCIRFQPQTHYFFSTGKDGVMKYWDADRFEQILFLPGHKGSIWGLEISSEGAMCYTTGQDRTIRLWERGEDLVFVEEERERALEAQVDKSAESENTNNLVINDNIPNSSNQLPTEGNSNGNKEDSLATAMKSIESVKGGEMLMDALDLVEAELAEIEEYNALNGNNKKARVQNQLLLGLTPYKYMLRALRLIKAPDLEQALLIMPFHYVTRFISMLIELAKRGLDIELCTRCAIFLIRCHQPQIVHTQSLLSKMAELQLLLSHSVNDYRSLIGMNLSALKFAQRIIDDRKEEGLI